MWNEKLKDAAVGLLRISIYICAAFLHYFSGEEPTAVRNYGLGVLLLVFFIAAFGTAYRIRRLRRTEKARFSPISIVANPFHFREAYQTMELLGTASILYGAGAMVCEMRNITEWPLSLEGPLFAVYGLGTWAGLAFCLVADRRVKSP